MSARYYCDHCDWDGEQPARAGDPPETSIFVQLVCPACGAAVHMDAILVRLLAQLTPREEVFLRWRFGLDGERRRRVSDIAQEFRLPRTRVSEILARAQARLWCRATREGPVAVRVVEEAIGPAPPCPHDRVAERRRPDGGASSG
jgi:hypothetical protein